MQAFDIADEDEDQPTPKATCNLNTQEILTLHGPAAGNLPARLKPYQPPTKPAYEPSPSKQRQRSDEYNRNNSGGGGGNQPGTSTKKGD
jgi:hypothetical protein